MQPEHQAVAANPGKDAGKCDEEATRQRCPPRGGEPGERARESAHAHRRTDGRLECAHILDSIMCPPPEVRRPRPPDGSTQKSTRKMVLLTS